MGGLYDWRPEFNASPGTDFAGSYDTAALKQRFGSPELWLRTSFWPANGELVVLGADAATAPLVATWTSTMSTPPTGGSGGTGGGAAGIDASPGSGGSSGTDASSGSGGTGHDASPE